MLIALSLGLPFAAMAQGAPLATAFGRTHDDVAQCLMRQMPPGFRAWPKVSPPPRRDAIVNMYIRGHGQGEDPIGVFHVQPTANDGLAISFVQTNGVRGEYDRIARIAAQRCAR
ncbi:MAG: hypothetical protein KF889_06485 [Alphaproteobacteria bacterium]|nr:hypothetical protein [Alphaproteobacteria bacterium]MCW5740466.1 hypothetical protein [Alphaproteobacteria bacterium]